MPDPQAEPHGGPTTTTTTATATTGAATTATAAGVRRAIVRTAWGIAAALAIAIVSHPWWLAPMVARDLAARSGRDVRFDSIRIGLTARLSPVAVLRGVRIANAPWADASVPFASLDEARFEFAWRRIEGRWVVSKLVLRGGQAHLEIGADGLRNWRLRQPQDRGPGHYWFQALEAHDASVSFAHPAVGLLFRAAASDVADGAERGSSSAASASASTSASSPAARSGDALTTHIVFDGRMRGIDYKGDVLTGPELTFRDTGRWFGLRGHAEVAGARLDADGRAADLFLLRKIDADATLAGDSLAALRPLTGAPAAAPRSFRAAGHVRVDGNRYALEGATARVGASDLAGELAWSREGDRSTVRARLRSESTSAADVLWLAGRSAVSGSASASASAPTTAGRDIFAPLRKLDADVAVEIRHLHAAPFNALQSAKLAARLDGRQLAISDLDIGWAGGHSTGNVGLDLRGPVAALDANVATTGVRVESLLPGADDKKRITGALGGRVALKAAGNDLAALRTSATGHAALALSGGTISSMLDAELGLEAGKMVRTLLSGTEALALPCAAAVVDVGNGRAELRSLVIDSANTRTTGSGSVDLRDESIDVVLTPEPKRPGIDLGRSIRLHGKLPKPEKSLVDRVAQPAGSACPAKPLN